MPLRYDLPGQITQEPESSLQIPVTECFCSSSVTECDEVVYRSDRSTGCRMSEAKTHFIYNNFIKFSTDNSASLNNFRKSPLPMAL